MSTTLTQTGALLGNKKGAGPKLALHNLYLGGDAAFDSLGGFNWAGGKRFSLADNSLEVYAKDTVNGRKTNKSSINFRFLQQRAANQKSETVNSYL